MLAAVGSASLPRRAAVDTLDLRVMSRVAMVVCVVCLTASAHADSRKAQVFPLAASGLPDNLSQAPAKLTKALAVAIKGQVASVPIEDAAGLLECDPESSTCLASVAKSVSAERLVFGSITYDKNRVKVTLTRFDVGPDRQQQTFELEGTTADALAKDLVKSSAPLFGGEAPLITEDKPIDETPPGGEPLPQTMPGKITSSTWAMIGGGAVLAAGGVVMLVSAQSIKRDVQNAPTATVEDIRRLRALEDRGVQRTLIGNVMMIGGGVVLAAGVVRAVIQRKSSPEAPVVQPAPVEGGAVLLFTVIR